MTNVNQPVTIFGFDVNPVSFDFNPYHEFHTWFTPEVKEKLGNADWREAFVDHLIETGKVIGVYEGEVSDGEPGVDYFDWFFMKAPLDGYSLIPTMEDMDEIEKVLKDSKFTDVTQRNKEILAVGHHAPGFQTAEFDHKTYLHWLGDTLSKANKIEEVTIQLFKEFNSMREKNIIAKQGFTVRNVFTNEDPWRYYSYTVGLTDQLGYELIMINGSRHSGTLLTDIVHDVLKNNPGLGVPFVNNDFKVVVGGDDIRLKMVEISLDSGNASFVREGVPEVKRVVQVQLGDKNNILPGEEGYDETFVQDIAVVH